jgi:hypothetical protein
MFDFDIDDILKKTMGQADKAQKMAFLTWFVECQLKYNIEIEDLQNLIEKNLKKLEKWNL